MEQEQEHDNSGDHQSKNPMRQLESGKVGSTQEYASSLLEELYNSATIKIEVESNSDTELPDRYEDLSYNLSRRPQIQSIESASNNCSHKVVWPADTAYEPLQNMNVEPAMSFQFELDAFQKEAIQCIENNQSTFVSAHTSSGKTAIALYAVAQSLRNQRRVFYTTPVKALSNQKYRELQNEFNDVGLLTGDVALNTKASCVVMTTEVLRSMLYNDSQIKHEVDWIIFDEVHFMRDKERGVVWEEAIILVRKDVNCLFLSATIPNAEQFAEWFCMLKVKPCHIVSTDYRPVPLQHFIFPATGKRLYEVVNQSGYFQENLFQEAMACLKGDDVLTNKFMQKGVGESNMSKIIRTTKEYDLLPAITFCFSRKECEAYALSLNMDFCDATEKKKVRMLFEKAILLLDEDDRKLPQINQMLPLLLRGIGIHHSGLFPLIKELAEVLFAEGLIKVLFATETFSTGLNLPAKSVIFTSARKFDGSRFRWITPEEYIQMSGRAGRRGKDPVGIVILLIDQQLSTDEARHIIKGTPDRLDSQFHLSYNMILNLFRHLNQGSNSPEWMLKRSFYEFQNKTKVPDLKERLNLIETEMNQIELSKESTLNELFQMQATIAELEEEIRRATVMPQQIVPFLHAGRLLHIKTKYFDFGWGALIDFKRTINPEDKGSVIFIPEVLMSLSEESLLYPSNREMLRPPLQGEKVCWEIVPMAIDCVYEVSMIRISLPRNLKPTIQRSEVGMLIQRCLESFNNKIPLLDPINDMKISDPKLEVQIETLKKLLNQFDENPIRQHKDFDSLCKNWKLKDEKRKEVKELQDELTKIEGWIDNKELSQRKQVLEKLEYCGKDGKLLPKGQICSELSTTDGLLLSEMLFGNVFDLLNEAEIAALLSCLVFEERTSKSTLPDNLSACLNRLQVHARRIVKESLKYKIEMDEEEFVNSFNPGLMQVVFLWASGKPASEVFNKTEVFEGTFIRCLRRLGEVLLELGKAAKKMGNLALENKFALTRSCVKRGMASAASIYI